MLSTMCNNLNFFFQQQRVDSK